MPNQPQIKKKNWDKVVDAELEDKPDSGDPVRSEICPFTFTQRTSVCITVCLHGTKLIFVCLEQNAGGDAALQTLFSSIYANADDDSKKAMIKSYTESGGTTLSTDWGSIGKGVYAILSTGRL